MEFGIQFFPDVGPQHKAPDVYFNECLALVDLVDRHGYSHVRIVEHYFHYYGGYSPNPLVFLAAASQRSVIRSLTSRPSALRASCTSRITWNTAGRPKITSMSQAAAR